MVLLLLVADDTESRRHRRHQRHRNRWRQRDEWPRGGRLGSQWRHRWNFPWFDFDINFDSGSFTTDWWDGPNICTHKERKNGNTSTSFTGHGQYSSSAITCEDKKTAYICTETLTSNGKTTIERVTKSCCHGYTRRSGQHGCPKYQQLDDIEKTAESLNLTEFLRAAESVGLKEQLKGTLDANFTIFAPTNEAFKKGPSFVSSYENVLLNDMGSVIRISPPISTVIVSDASDLVLSHVTGGILTTTTLEDEQTITSANSKSSTIRINFYDMVDNGVMTANCKRVSSRNNLATNGVIHVVDEVLQPVTKSLTDIVSSNPQLSYLKTALGTSGISHDLRLEGQFTLLAPTDNAFRKLDGQLLNRTLTDKRCLKKIINNHLLPNVICSSAVSGSHKSKTKNKLSKYLQLMRDDNDKIFVEKSQIIDRDIMASNGVLHLIDDVIIPEEAYAVMEVLEKRKLTRLSDLISEAGLKKSLEQANDITILVPTNEAFSKMSEFDRARLNESNTADIVKYHVIKELSTCRVADGHQFSTWNTKKTLTVHRSRSLYYRFFEPPQETIQCSSIVKYGIPSCNAVIHLIDKVLIPPVGTVVDVLEVDNRFSEFVKLMKNSGLADELQQNGPYTVLAPTNEVLNALTEEEMKNLQSSKDNLKEFVKDHVIRGHMCCSNFRLHVFGFHNVRTISGVELVIRKTGRHLTVSSSDILECDMVGTNGVVHAIGGILGQEQETEYNEYDFFNMFRW